MINTQFSKCPECGRDEKYVRFVGNKEVVGCKNMCMREESEPKMVIVRDNNSQKFVSEGGLR